MRFEKGNEVYVNYMDGVIKTKILHVHRDGYSVEVRGTRFHMGFNEVSLEAKVISGVPPIKRASCGAEE